MSVEQRVVRLEITLQRKKAKPALLLSAQCNRYPDYATSNEIQEKYRRRLPT